MYQPEQAGKSREEYRQIRIQKHILNPIRTLFLDQSGAGGNFPGVVGMKSEKQIDLLLRVTGKTAKNSCRMA